MTIEKSAVAGTLESSDAQITVEPAQDGIQLEISSSVMNQYGRQIKATVLDTLERHGLAPARLKLELTERVLAGDIRRVRAVMEALAARGVEFYLDDFGTGYSNLSSVVSLPLQYVKVDRSLLEAATNGGGGALLLRAVVETFRAMGRGILLEGVETPEQYALACTLRADRLQGYYLARPMPGEELCALMCSGARRTRRT